LEAKLNAIIAYVTIDGGRTAPQPDGIIRDAALLRIEFVSVPPIP